MRKGEEKILGVVGGKGEQERGEERRDNCLLHMRAPSDVCYRSDKARRMECCIFCEEQPHADCC